MTLILPLAMHTSMPQPFISHWLHALLVPRLYFPHRCLSPLILLFPLLAMLPPSRSLLFSLGCPVPISPLFPPWLPSRPVYILPPLPQDTTWNVNTSHKHKCTKRWTLIFRSTRCMYRIYSPLSLTFRAKLIMYMYMNKETSKSESVSLSWSCYSQSSYTSTSIQHNV